MSELLSASFGSEELVQRGSLRYDRSDIDSVSYNSTSQAHRNQKGALTHSVQPQWVQDDQIHRTPL